MINLNEFTGKKLIELFDCLLNQEEFDINLFLLIFAAVKDKSINLTCSPWYEAYKVLSDKLTECEILKLEYFEENDAIAILIDLEKEGC